MIEQVSTTSAARNRRLLSHHQSIIHHLLKLSTSARVVYEAGSAFWKPWSRENVLNSLTISTTLGVTQYAQELMNPCPLWPLRRSKLDQLLSSISILLLIIQIHSFAAQQLFFGL